ncbi:SapC family protein [Oleiagrimonas sp. MCCC 1A03011]|uniref:SapC family protein n=1 Tax=Oleiagrimonas sp. MCCC 1A03011 TaxID=1926883 RepID=UPI000DC471D0|nr:SapC family protein [Oleiagrimonas sp. MCCC 1A03011]RAP59432.1 multidrug transporter [Oleiagrimonas sp. MCCC 1A03011]
MSEVLFYERPVPLNRDSHKNLRIKPIPSAAFAAKAHSVPLSCVEFPHAAHHYPILFAGDSLDDLNPIVLLGLRQEENLMVDENGFWASDTYVPAFVRRYPFVLAEKPPEEGKDGDDFAVFLDEAYPGFGTEEGQRLFNEDGTDTDTLKQAVAFLGEFQQHIRRTRELMKRLHDLELFTSRTIEIKMPGKNVVLNGLYVVDEQKLQGLDAETLHGLMQDGSLTWIFAHLFSLSNLDRLVQRMHARFTPEERAEFEAKMREEAENQAKAGNDA